MAKMTRVLQKLFASTASAGQLSKYGSLAAGSPVTYSGATVDPLVLQSLSNFLSGIDGGLLGSNSPAKEDFNSLFYLAFRQLAYLFEQGIAEWDATTTYYIGSIVNVAGVLYTSITDTNLNNAVTVVANWKPLNQVRNYIDKTANYTLTDTDDFVNADSTASSFNITLPTAVGRMGKTFTIKAKAVGTFTVTVLTTSSQTIDGVTSYVFTIPYECITVISDNSGWFIVN